VNGSGCQSENARASGHGDEDGRAIFHVRGIHRVNVSAHAREASRANVRGGVGLRASELLSARVIHLSENAHELLRASDHGGENLSAIRRESGSENAIGFHARARGYAH